MRQFSSISFRNEIFVGIEGKNIIDPEYRVVEDMVTIKESMGDKLQGKVIFVGMYTRF
jgi:hypothetical protein